MSMTPLKRIWPDDDNDYVMVVYNGKGKPACTVTCPREVNFIVHPFLGLPRPSASCWIVSEIK